jgi:hypothetical protein
LFDVFFFLAMSKGINGKQKTTTPIGEQKKSIATTQK